MVRGQEPHANLITISARGELIRRITILRTPTPVLETVQGAEYHLSLHKAAGGRQVLAPIRVGEVTAVARQEALEVLMVVALTVVEVAVHVHPAVVDTNQQVQQSF
jgi:hypothetical protein